MGYGLVPSFAGMLKQRILGERRMGLIFMGGPHLAAMKVKRESQKDFPTKNGQISPKTHGLENVFPIGKVVPFFRGRPS